MEIIKRRKVMNEDRISQLPEHLQHQILSNLSFDEAAATTVLSSSWKEVWLTLPYLCLDEDFFSNIKQNQQLDVFHEQFFDQIYRLRSNCAHHKTKMLEVLKLHIPTNPISMVNLLESPITYLVDTFIIGAVNDFQVKKLDVSSDTRKHFPIFLRSWKQVKLTHLTLSGCIVYSCKETKLSNLRCLSLEHVFLSQEVLDSFTTNCNLIESFSIVYCAGKFNTLNASCLKRLVTLNIRYTTPSFKKIVIDAPNLKHFRFSGLGPGNLYVLIHGLASSKGLKSLAISHNAAITDEWLNHINIVHLTKLERLCLVGCPNLRHIRISSSSLTTIFLKSFKLEEFKIIDAPRLCRLLYFGTPIPSFILNNANALANTKVRLFLKNQNRNNIIEDAGLQHEKLVTFLGLFNSIITRSLQVELTKDIIVPPDIRKRLSPPLVVVKNLKLNYVALNREELDDIVEYVDGLVWLTPQPQTVDIKFKQCHFSKTLKMLKFKYKKDDESLEKCDYCELLPVRCWRHCLKKVTIRNLESGKSSTVTELDAKLEEFFNPATKSQKS